MSCQIITVGASVARRCSSSPASLAKAQAALKAVQSEIGHIAKLISYGIGASGGIAAAFFILAKQNLGAGAIATTAAVAGIALPSMFASGALI